MCSKEIILFFEVDLCQIVKFKKFISIIHFVIKSSFFNPQVRNSITHLTFWHYCIPWPEAMQCWWCRTPLPPTLVPIVLWPSFVFYEMHPRSFHLLWTVFENEVCKCKTYLVWNRQFLFLKSWILLLDLQICDSFNSVFYNKGKKCAAIAIKTFSIGGRSKTTWTRWGR